MEAALKSDDSDSVVIEQFRQTKPHLQLKECDCKFSFHNKISRTRIYKNRLQFITTRRRISSPKSKRNLIERNELLWLLASIAFG